ncbi:unnamed protein product [Caenorhabditis sp. 36 PRJEB53466]|nr:unnamed protein product [Caenorhabditis sp. 36 PRJEB53466]
MTCVIFPLTHVKLWKSLLRPVLIVLFLSPFGVIWNIVISRVYINPNGGGFSVNYKDTVSWANVSLLHLAYSVISFVLVVTSFFATIFGLFMLEKRVKGTERALTLATMLMAVQMMIFALIQIYFAFFAVSNPSIRQILLLAVVVVYDSMNVFSPIALLLMSRQLRKDVFGLQDNSTVVPSRTVSTVSQGPFRSVSTTMVAVLH